MKVTRTVDSGKALDGFFSSDERNKEFQAFARPRRLISRLVAMRASKGVTQGRIAEEMNCGQARVSKLESGVDADLNISDLEAYAKATNSEVTILISARGKSLADQVKHHALSIRKALLSLVDLAHKDGAIAQGVARLHLDAFVNINAFIAESAGKMPVAENGRPYIKIAEEIPDEVEPAVSPRKPNGRRKQSVTATE